MRLLKQEDHWFLESMCTLTRMWETGPTEYQSCNNAIISAIYFLTIVVHNIADTDNGIEQHSPLLHSTNKFQVGYEDLSFSFINIIIKNLYGGINCDCWDGQTFISREGY